VLVVVVIFAFIFWGDLIFNQNEIANTPLPPDPILETSGQMHPTGQSQPDNTAEATANLSSDDDYDDLEKDLTQTDVNVDSDSAQLESEMSGL
jgi:hypothetical protein